jgi:hypothetical protein
LFCFCLNLFFVGSICLTGRSRAKDKPGQPRATHCVAVKWLLAKIKKLFLRKKVRILLLIICYLTPVKTLKLTLHNWIAISKWRPFVHSIICLSSKIVFLLHNQE